MCLVRPWLWRVHALGLSRKGEGFGLGSHAVSGGAGGTVAAEIAVSERRSARTVTQGMWGSISPETTQRHQSSGQPNRLNLWGNFDDASGQVCK